MNSIFLWWKQASIQNEFICFAEKLSAYKHQPLSHCLMICSWGNAVVLWVFSRSAAQLQWGLMGICGLLLVDTHFKLQRLLTCISSYTSVSGRLWLFLAVGFVAFFQALTHCTVSNVKIAVLSMSRVYPTLDILLLVSLPLLCLFV